MTWGHAVEEVAHQMALVPLVWIMWSRFRGEKRDVAWVWLAIAFSVSWMADLAADFMQPGMRFVPSMVYPVSQTAIIGAVLLDRTESIALLGLLVPIAMVGVRMGGATGPDIILRSFAWLVIVGIAWMRADLPHRLRLSLIVYFGLGYVTWLLFAEQSIVPVWFAYQSTRLAGILLFCWAASENSPQLRLVR